MGLISLAATGLAGLLGPLLGQPAPAPVKVPNAPLIAAPASAQAGTMLMVHGGGWAGPAPMTQQSLMTMPGETFGQRGWKIVSVDYHAGASGLQDVVDAANAQIAQPSGGPLCIYGESAGGQLALVAAARLGSAVDCVIAFAPPDDFETYQTEAHTSNDPDRLIIAQQMATVWGSTPDQRAPDDPIKLVSQITSDVMLLREADDPLIPVAQIDNFVAARPTTERVELESALRSDPSGFYLHGTMSDHGRDEYRSAIGSFADRAVAAYNAEQQAAATGCKGVATTVSQGGVRRVATALRCLARSDAVARKAGAAGARTISRRVRGEVNAARTWTLLRASVSGRRALAALAAGRVSTTVRSGDPNRITLRVRR